MIIQETVLFIIPLGCLYLVLRGLWNRRKGIFSSWKREFSLFILVLYLAAVLKITIIPDITFMWLPDEKRFLFQTSVGSVRTPNLIPFRTVIGFIRGETFVNENESVSVILKNLLGNLVLLMPLGTLLPILFGRLKKLSIVVACGSALASVIEVIQFFIGRVADIDDVILNSVGVLIGYIVYQIYERKSRITKKKIN